MVGARIRRAAGRGVIASRAHGELRFAPGGESSDLRGRTWSLEGELDVIGGELHDGLLHAPTYPDVLSRAWSGLTCRTSGEVMLSAAPGWEFLDWGRQAHLGGASHGSLRAEDSLGALLIHGVQGDWAPPQAGQRPRPVGDPRCAACHRCAFRALRAAPGQLRGHLPAGASRPVFSALCGCSWRPLVATLRGVLLHRRDHVGSPMPAGRVRVPLPVSVGAQALRQPGARNRQPPAEDARRARQVSGLLWGRLPEGPPPLAGQLLLQAGQGDRPGHRRRPHGQGARTVDGLSDRLVDGPRLPRLLRSPRERAVHLDPAERALLRRFLRLAPPLPLLHFDLLVLLSFSASLAFFNHGRIYVSTPLAYPPLLYLLVRMLIVGRVRLRRRAAGEAGPPAVEQRARLLIPAPWLAIALVFLVGFRIGLNVTDSNVIDVGYSGVIGAERIARRQRAVRRLPDGQRTRRHLRSGQLPGLRPVRAGLRLGRPLGRPAARPTRPRSSSTCVRRVAVPARPPASAGRSSASCSPTRGSPSRSRSSRWRATQRHAGGRRSCWRRCWCASRPPARGALAALAGLTKFAPLALAPLLATTVCAAAAGRARRALRLCSFGGWPSR